MSFKEITILAALRSFYDSGDDLLSVFCSMVLSVLLIEKKSISNIQIDVEEKYKLQIPIDVLHTILRRLRRSDFIEYESLKDIFTKTIYLTESGNSQKVKIWQSIESAEREKNALLNSIKVFYKDKYDTGIIEKNLYLFIETNSYNASQILNKKEQQEIEADDEIQSNIALFFIESEKSDPQNFDRLKSILLGKIISSALLKGNFDKNAKFSKLEVYLDTNIVFSLLGFHEDSYNIATEEMIEILRKLNLNLKIFSFTKDEIVQKLSGYLRDFSKYPSSIKVDSIYSVLKRKGYSKSAVISIINNIEQNLAELNIEIDYLFSQRDLLMDCEKERSKMEQFIEKQHPASFDHDLAAICALKKLRHNKSSFLLEKSNCIFLTADSRLSTYNFSTHESLHSIPEIMHRNELTSILWLKNQDDGDKIYIHNFLIGHTRQSIISKALWEKFLHALENEKTNGTLSDDQIDEIISWEETGKLLQTKKEAGITLIIDDQKVKQKQEELQQKDEALEQFSVNNAELQELLKKEKQNVGSLTRELENQNDQLNKIHKKIEEDCRKKCTNFVNCLLWPPLGLYAFIVIWLSIRYGISFYNLVFLLPLFIFIELRFQKNVIPIKFKEYLPDWLDFPTTRDQFQNRLITSCIRKRRKKLNIQEEEVES